MINTNEFSCSMPEFVGTTVLDTIGLVIPGIDETIKKQMNTPYSALGVISSRTGAAGQIVAVDEAIKNTNTHIVTIELPRDTKGWGGHGNYIVLGGNDVSDVRRAVEIALEQTTINAGEVHISKAGHLEFAYSASAGEALNQFFNIPLGRAFGFMAGSPAAIGLVMADKAVKSSNVEITKYMTPNKETSHTNEVIIAFTGDTSAVKNAVLTAREIGLKLLISLGSYPESPSPHLWD